VFKYFLSFRIFEQLALALKNRVCPEFFHCMENTFCIQNFEQVALALKNRAALEFSLYWIRIFYHSGFLSNLSLPWKNRVALKFFAAYIQEFSTTCACPKRQICLKFFAVLNILFTFRSFEQLALAVKSRGCPKFTVLNMYFLFSGVLRKLRLPWKTEFALKIFKPGGAAAPPTPASYAYA